MVPALAFSIFVHGLILLAAMPVRTYSGTESGKNSISISMGSVNIGENFPEKENIGARPRKEDGRVERRHEIAATGAEDVAGRSGWNDRDEGKAKNRYFSEIRERIERVKQYPAYAVKMGFEGIVEIDFLILSDGCVRAVEMTKPSPYRVLNEAAIDAVKKAAPFPPLPAEFGGPSIKLTFPMVFCLKGGGGSQSL